MTAYIEIFAKRFCQDAQKSLKVVSPPVQPIKPPCEPQKNLAIDLAGPFSSINRYLFVIIDSLTKWPEVFIVKNINLETIIECLESLFLGWGFPDSVISNNDSQFVSEKLNRFLTECKIDHKLTWPYNPQCNGQAENFIKFLKSQLTDRSFTTIHSFQSFLHKLLFSFRCTPHSTTGVTPSYAMLGRNLKCGLPEPSGVETGGSNRGLAIQRRIISNQRKWRGTQRKGPFFRIGDYVRVKLLNGAFSDSHRIVKSLHITEASFFCRFSFIMNNCCIRVIIIFVASFYNSIR